MWSENMLFIHTYWYELTRSTDNEICNGICKITCDQTPTVHRGDDDWEDVCVDVCLISSHAGISHTSLVGKSLASVQAPSAILIVNEDFTSWTHSSSRVRTPAPQEVEQSLHGPPRHLSNIQFLYHFQRELKTAN